MYTFKIFFTVYNNLNLISKMSQSEHTSNVCHETSSWPLCSKAEEEFLSGCVRKTVEKNCVQTDLKKWVTGRELKKVEEKKIQTPRPKKRKQSDLREWARKEKTEEEELVHSELTTKMSNMEETGSWPLCSSEDDCPVCYSEEEEEDNDSVESDWSSFCLHDEDECPHCYREEEEEDYDGVESDWSSFCLDDEGEEELEDIPPPSIQHMPPPPIQNIPPPLILQMIELGNGLWIEFDIWNNHQLNWIQTPSSSDSGFTDTDTDTD